MLSVTAPTKEASAVEVSDGTYLRYGKRAFDLVCGIVLVVVFSPLLFGIALALRASLGPGVLFRQERIGRNGQPFTCLKFRTMSGDRRQGWDDFTGEDRRRTHKSEADPRHTQVGQVLRKYSLDELPQLWNLVRGEMSLVGPRPEMATVADSVFVNHVRHSLRPGLTGPYQLSDLRLDGCLKAGLGLDEQYVHSVSLRQDLGILMRTVLVVVRGTGA